MDLSDVVRVRGNADPRGRVLVDAFDVALDAAYGRLGGRAAEVRVTWVPLDVQVPDEVLESLFKLNVKRFQCCTESAEFLV